MTKLVFVSLNVLTFHYGCAIIINMTERKNPSIVEQNNQLDRIFTNVGLGLAALGLVAGAGRLLDNDQSSIKHEPTKQEEILNTVDAIRNGNEALPEGATSEELTLPEDSSIIAQTTEWSESLGLTSDERNAARGTILDTSHAAIEAYKNETGAPAIIQPGTVYEVAVGDINADGKKDVVVIKIDKNGKIDNGAN